MASQQTPAPTRYRIFVYGTLRPGGYYFNRICPNYSLTHYPAQTKGKLYHLPMGYPAMCRGEETVYGDLLCFDDPILKQALDQLEGYQEYRAPELNDYNLKAIEAWSPSGQILAEVYAYLMDPQKITALGGQHLPDGNWPPQSQA